MRVLLTSADGFIGRALALALVQRGHAVIGLRRPSATARPRLPGLEYREADFNRDLTPAAWQPRLADVDVLVNTVGILRETRTQRFDTLHVRAPTALFQAAVACGVGRVIQVSALGADADARSGYHRSKRRADEALAATVADWVVAQPSLVYGPDGRSARAFESLASLPVIPLPGRGDMQVQPIHLDDLVAALVALIEAPRIEQRRVALVGPRPLAWRDFLAALHAGLGLPPPRFLSVPLPLVRLAAPLLAAWPGGLVDRDTLGMLERGNAASSADTAALLGHPPRDVLDFVTPAQRDDRAAAARLRWLLPMLRVSLAAMWLVSGYVSLFVYPRAASLALLERAGVPDAWAPLALASAALLDVALGLACLWPRPGRGWWRAQIILVLAYTAIISLRLPEFWAHPYGPLVKNLPVLVALLMLHEFEPRR